MLFGLDGLLKYQALAEELAAQSRVENLSAFVQMGKNWSISLLGRDISVALAARGGIFECLAADIILGTEPDFSSSANTVIDWGCRIADHFSPAPELLIVELSLAIALRDSRALQISQAILSYASADEFYSLERAQAQALALIVNRNPDAATEHAHRLRKASLDNGFCRDDCLVGALWSTVFQRMVDGDYRNCLDSLGLCSKEFSRQIDRKLARLQRGQETDLSVFEMVDWPALAISARLQDFSETWSKAW
jgi:hypothetical protein